MPKFRVFLAQVQARFTLKKADEELEDELQEHLRLLTERFVRQGMPPSEAAIAARRQFGNVALLQQRQREQHLHRGEPERGSRRHPAGRPVRRHHVRAGAPPLQPGQRQRDADNQIAECAESEA